MDNEDKIDLLPCPICGGKVRYSFDLDGIPNYINCPTCHMYVKYSNLNINRNARVGIAMAKMAERWNRRCNDDPDTK